MCVFGVATIRNKIGAIGFVQEKLNAARARSGDYTTGSMSRFDFVSFVRFEFFFEICSYNITFSSSTLRCASGGNPGTIFAPRSPRGRTGAPLAGQRNAPHRGACAILPCVVRLIFVDLLFCVAYRRHRRRRLRLRRRRRAGARAGRHRSAAAAVAQRSRPSHPIALWFGLDLRVSLFVSDVFVDLVANI